MHQLRKAFNVRLIAVNLPDPLLSAVACKILRSVMCGARRMVHRMKRRVKTRTMITDR